MQNQINGERTRLIKGNDRVHYDKQSACEILDCGSLCHVVFVLEGEARMLPTAYVRLDDAIYPHGHLKSL